MADEEFEEGAPRPDTSFAVNSASLALPPEVDPVTVTSQSYSLSTLAIHADDHLAITADVAPPIHVSTTFRYPGGYGNHHGEVSPDDLISARELRKHPDYFIYSRVRTPNTARLEHLLSTLLTPHPPTPESLHPTLTYASGQSAFHSALYFFRPRTLFLSPGYHGITGLSHLYSLATGMKILPLTSASSSTVAAGDLIHIETPLNPTGTAVQIAPYAELAHRAGAYLIIDSTFAPPPMQDAFAEGADMVMHSSTKYFGGHSDMLGGVLALNRDITWPGGLRKAVEEMMMQRLLLGAVPGSLEAWLTLRSLRTLNMRVRTAAENAGKLVAWLSGCLSSNGGESAARSVLKEMTHASLQHEDQEWLRRQMAIPSPPVFSMMFRTERLAKHFPSRLKLFHHATSLGGVESLVEWRAMTDENAERGLVRVSVGCEDWVDLKADIDRALKELAEWWVGEGED